MELEDIPKVFSLGERVFPADKWPNLYRTWDEYELVDLFAADGDTCLVAELDEDVVGFALGTVIEKRRSAWTYGYLLWLGVDQELPPLGIGGKLFARMQDLFVERGARIMLVDTASENEKALEFFRKQGFGGEQGHVFLSKNLDEEIETAQERRRRRRRSLRRPTASARALPTGDSE
jgi:ribosomal protein S18 acetylase RimI-like enzyme